MDQSRLHREARSASLTVAEKASIKDALRQAMRLPILELRPVPVTTVVYVQTLNVR